ncbi:hypothetical protein B0H10DRAFT_2230082 [Mycena sp. CBHHK59/15]|nr:hypothetical protein B0H10DRAFT_2230082 [Mycena sp. CBHHK59/15]
MAAVIAEDATALISWINNHGKVRKIFDAAQKIISLDHLGKIIILAYLVANLMCWTTHFVAFCRLFLLRAALQLAVLQNRSAVIAAEVGTVTSTSGLHLREDAERFCALIEDSMFWNGLETVLGDLEPICLGMNINQKDSTRLEQVLLMIAGIFLRFTNHPEPEVKKAMLIRLEKRWKDCDQDVFLAALILNPLLISLYRWMADRPENLDSPEQRKLKEGEVSKAIIQYLSGMGDFNDFEAEAWEEIQGNIDPIAVWKAFTGSKHLAELAEFTIVITTLLSLEKIDMCTKVKGQIRSDHQRDGIYKPRKARKNHKSTANLLAVSRYRDLLDDQDDEDPTRLPAWLQMTPRVLFGGAEKPRARKPSVQVIEEEELLMQALAEELEDDVPDDGAIEIDSEDEYHA